MTRRTINPTSSASLFKNIKKILVIKFRHIGDVLLTVPTIRALKETFSDASVSVLVNSGTEEVLSGNPIINELMVFDRAIKDLPIIKRYIEEAMFLKKIRTKGFNMTVDLTGGDRSAVLSFLSGARYRLAADLGRKGFIGKKYLYTHLANIDRQKHIVLQNLDVVKRFGITTDNTNVDFFVPEEIKQSIKKTLVENGITEKDKIVHVHPTSRWLFKCWKDEYMAEIISWLIDKGVKVVVTSAPDKREMDKAKRILSLVLKKHTEVKKMRSYEDKNFSTSQPLNFLTSQTSDSNLIYLCGKTSIKQLAAVSEASDLFIGVDSAPMHIAAAVGTPVIALFGPTGKEWMPYCKGNIVISKDMPCKPCKKGMCEGIELRDCMTAIKPDDVKEAVNKILKEAL